MLHWSEGINTCDSCNGRKRTLEDLKKCLSVDEKQLSFLREQFSKGLVTETQVFYQKDFNEKIVRMIENHGK